jgi:hypothetical protein
MYEVILSPVRTGHWLGSRGIARHRRIIRYTTMADLLREYRILFERIADGKPLVDVERHGERSKLGGTPDWEQYDETPECPHCKQEMTFVAQIDSIEHDSKTNPHRVYCLSKDQDYMFGDVGMIYVFFCFDCCQSKSIFQCG